MMAVTTEFCAAVALRVLSSSSLESLRDLIRPYCIGAHDCTLAQLEAGCLAEPTCVAFNTHGWLKSRLVYDDRAVHLWSPPELGR